MKKKISVIFLSIYITIFSVFVPYQEGTRVHAEVVTLTLAGYIFSTLVLSSGLFCINQVTQQDYDDFVAWDTLQYDDGLFREKYDDTLKTALALLPLVNSALHENAEKWEIDKGYSEPTAGEDKIIHLEKFFEQKYNSNNPPPTPKKPKGKDLVPILVNSLTVYHIARYLDYMSHSSEPNKYNQNLNPDIKFVPNLGLKTYNQLIKIPDVTLKAGHLTFLEFTNAENWPEGYATSLRITYNLLPLSDKRFDGMNVFGEDDDPVNIEQRKRSFVAYDKTSFFSSTYTDVDNLLLDSEGNYSTLDFPILTQDSIVFVEKPEYKYNDYNKTEYLKYYYLPKTDTKISDVKQPSPNALMDLQNHGNLINLNEYPEYKGALVVEMPIKVTEEVPNPNTGQVKKKVEIELPKRFEEVVPRPSETDLFKYIESPFNSPEEMPNINPNEFPDLFVEPSPKLEPGINPVPIPVPIPIPNPFPIPVPEPVPEIEPVPEVPIEPSPEEALPKIDFSPLMRPLKDKFPFCVPFDLVDAGKSFFRPSSNSNWQPIFNLKWKNATLVLDLTIFSSLFRVFKSFMLAFFILGLIKLTRYIIGET